MRNPCLERCVINISSVPSSRITLDGAYLSDYNMLFFKNRIETYVSTYVRKRTSDHIDGQLIHNIFGRTSGCIKHCVYFSYIFFQFSIRGSLFYLLGNSSAKLIAIMLQTLKENPYQYSCRILRDTYRVLFPRHSTVANAFRP